ncbi:MAG: nucleotide pyrophosphohydrolase [bacterium]
MSLKPIQQQVDDWVSQCKIGYFQPLEILARLTEETGELAREINHRYGPKKKKPTEQDKEIGDEIADIIFTLVCMANSLQIDLEQSFQKMMDKLNNRDKERWEKK